MRLTLSSPFLIKNLDGGIVLYDEFFSQVHVVCSPMDIVVHELEKNLLTQEDLFLKLLKKVPESEADNTFILLDQFIKQSIKSKIMHSV